MFAGAHHGDGIHEFDLYFHFRPNIAAQTLKYFPKDLVVETVGFHDLDGHVAKTFLDNLKLPNHVVEILKVVHEECAGQVIAVGAHNDGLGPAFDAPDSRQSAA